MKEIYCNLASILKGKGISVYRLSRDTGIAEATIRKYVKNKNISFDKNVLKKICNFLNTEIDQIIKSK